MNSKSIIYKLCLYACLPGLYQIFYNIRLMIEIESTSRHWHIVAHEIIYVYKVREICANEKREEVGNAYGNTNKIKKREKCINVNANQHTQKKKKRKRTTQLNSERNIKHLLTIQTRCIVYYEGINTRHGK